MDDLFGGEEGVDAVGLFLLGGIVAEEELVDVAGLGQALSLWLWRSSGWAWAWSIQNQKLQLI